MVLWSGRGIYPHALLLVRVDLGIGFLVDHNTHIHVPFGTRVTRRHVVRLVKCFAGTFTSPPFAEGRGLCLASGEATPSRIFGQLEKIEEARRVGAECSGHLGRSVNPLCGSIY